MGIGFAELVVLAVIAMVALGLVAGVAIAVFLVIRGAKKPD